MNDQILQDDQTQKKYIKMVLVGQSGVGKTNFISRYVENKFSIGNNTTIGLEFSQKMVSINGKSMILQIWDTAGQQRFRALNKTFYKNSLGAMILFDLNDKQTFQKLGCWIGQLKDNLPQSAVYLLIGNKCDKKENQISVSEAMELAKKQGMGYLQTSAALGINVKEAFQLLTRKILQRVQQIKQFTMKTVQQKPISIKPKKQQQNQKKKQKCTPCK